MKTNQVVRRHTTVREAVTWVAISPILGEDSHVFHGLRVPRHLYVAVVCTFNALCPNDKAHHNTKKRIAKIALDAVERVYGKEEG